MLWVWPTGTGTSCVPGSSGHAFGTSAALGKICHVDLCAIFNFFWNHFHSWNTLSTSLCSYFPVLDILHFTGDRSGMRGGLVHRSGTAREGVPSLRVLLM